MLKAIYFDYHGVLDHRTFGGLVQTLQQAGVSAPALTELTSASEAYARGTMEPREWWALVEHLGGPTAATAGKKYILHVDPRRAMWELVNTLQVKYSLGLFSDCPMDKKDIIIRAYNLPDFFEHLVFSCDVRLSKQDASFYRLMDQSGQFQPNEILLIDDNERAIAMAQAHGYAAHHFVTPDETIHYLSHL